MSGVAPSNLLSVLGGTPVDPGSAAGSLIDPTTEIGGTPVPQGYVIQGDSGGNWILGPLPGYRILTALGSIDLTAAAGTTTLYAPPPGKSAFLTAVMLRPTTITAPAGDAQCGVGITTGEDDIIPQTVISGWTTTNDVFMLAPSPNAILRIVNPGDTVLLGRDVADTGTALTVTAYVLGIEF